MFLHSSIILVLDKNEELIPSINKISSNPENEESIKCTDLARIAENRLSPFQFNTDSSNFDYQDNILYRFNTSFGPTITMANYY